MSTILAQKIELWFFVVRPVSSRQAKDDCEDLSARSGGSGPLGGTDDPALLLLFSSLVWQGWVRLWLPSPLTETVSNDGESKEKKDCYEEKKNLCIFFVIIQYLFVTPSKMQIITQTRYKEKQNEILKEKQVIHFGDSTFPWGDSEIVMVAAPPSDRRCVSHAPRCCWSVTKSAKNTAVHKQMWELHAKISRGSAKLQ